MLCHKAALLCLASLFRALFVGYCRFQVSILGPPKDCQLLGRKRGWNWRGDWVYILSKRICFRNMRKRCKRVPGSVTTRRVVWVSAVATWGHVTIHRVIDSEFRIVWTEALATVNILNNESLPNSSDLHTWRYHCCFRKGKLMQTNAATGILS